MANPLLATSGKDQIPALVEGEVMVACPLTGKP